MNLTLTTFLLLFSLNSFALDSCKHDQTNFRCVKYVRNYDADTVTFNIPNVHPLIGKKINIRVSGVDTPEIRTKNKCEKEKGKYAKGLVTNLLKNAKRIDLENIKRGKYFRVVADIKIDGQYLSKYLLRNGLAYPYYGKTKKKLDWCKSSRDIASEYKSH